MQKTKLHFALLSIQICWNVSSTFGWNLKWKLTCPASLSSQDFKRPVVQLLNRVWLFDPMDCSMPGFPVLHYLLELAQTYVHRFGDTIQPSHPLSSPSPPAFTLSQHQGLFQWVSSSYQVSKVLELQVQHQSFQGTASSHAQLLFSHLGSPAIASWDLCLL